MLFLLIYPELLDKVKIKGEYIYLYDGTVRAKVIQTRWRSSHAQNRKSWNALSSRKGVNFPNTVIDIDVITKKDEIDIAWGVEEQG